MRFTPMTVIRAMMQELTILGIDKAIKRMSQDNPRFIRLIIETSQSGTVVITDTKHQVNDLAGIAVPVRIVCSP